MTQSFFSSWFDQDPNERPKVKDLEKNAIDRLDRWDRQDYDDIDAQMRDFRLDRREVEGFAETGAELWEDTYHSFQKFDPQLKDRGRMKPTYLINHVVAEEFENMAEYERLRTWTVGDVVASAMACSSMKDDVIALYDRANKRREQDEPPNPDGSFPGCGWGVERGMEDYEATEQGIRDMEDMIEAWKNLPELTEEQEAEMQATQEALNQAAQDLQQKEIQLRKDMEKLEDDIRGAVKASLPSIRAHMSEEAESNEQLATAAGGWGVEPGELQKMDAEQRAKLAARLTDNPRIKKLTEIIGAMERTALECNTRKVYHSFEEVYDVSVGDDLGRILPEELVMLADPTLELDFMQRYTEGKLLQYEMSGQEKMAKGGIIFAMDNSGSMAGDPEVWAKAVGLATLSIARSQKRSFYGIHFSSKSQIKTFDFRKPEDITLDGVLEYAEHFFGGGTDFEAPLKKALSILQEEFNRDGAVKGDIIMVTDGICGISDAFKEKFKAEQERIGFSVYGLMIGPYRKREPLWSLCDEQVVTITDLLTGENVKELFRVL